MVNLPTYRELKTMLPLSAHQSHMIESKRRTIVNILNHLDSRLLLIVGPCSIHDPESAIEFATKLNTLASDPALPFFLVMRVYCEKPRTQKGWKGYLYDPYLDDSCDVPTGLNNTRQLLLDLAAMGIPAATEFLDPLTAFYYDDLISWGSIGARTSSSQIHRQLASSLSMPIGIKNGVAGNISAAIDGVISSSLPHTFLGINDQGQKAIVRSTGNPHAHVVLRGGESGPNFDQDSVKHVSSQLKKNSLLSSLVIDCSHHNSNKHYPEQVNVFQSVIHQTKTNRVPIRGLMLESHLFAGQQQLNGSSDQLKYGVSITDACLDWESTEQLIRWGAKQLNP